jgi:hypothetical protein
VRNLETLPTLTAPLNFSDDPIALVNPDTGAALGADTSSNQVMLGVLAMIRKEQIARQG